MRQRACLAAGMAAIVVLSSCVPVLSLHALYTAKDIVAQPQLLGKWMGEDDTEKVQLEIAQGEGKCYALTLTDNSKTPGEQDSFNGCAVKLGARTFFDLEQTDVSVGGEGNIMWLAIPAHMLGKFHIEGDTLTFSFLDDDWVKGQIQAGKLPLKMEIIENTPVFTGPTAQIQEYVRAHADDEKAFSDTFTFHRAKP